MVNLKEAIDYLIANGYIIARNNKYILMEQKLKKDLSKSMAVAVITSIEPVQPVTVTSIANYQPQEDWVGRYKTFIIDAKVPKRGENRYGEEYDVNKYSEDGMKAFKKAIQDGYSYEILVASTALYYKNQKVKMKVSIGRYMKEGQWRTYYDEVISKAENNTLKEHIKSELDNGQHSFTRLG